MLIDAVDSPPRPHADIVVPGGGAPGIEQPVMGPGPPSVFPDFTPILPPPNIGEGGSVQLAVAPGGGPDYDPITDGGAGPAEFPLFSTTWPVPPVPSGGFMIGNDVPPSVATTPPIVVAGVLKAQAEPQSEHPPQTPRTRRRRT